MMRSIFVVLFLIAVFPFGVRGEKVAVLEELSRPEMIEVDGDELFVIEEASIFVYSLKDYSLITKFGKRGDGPGELIPRRSYKLQLRVHQGNILVNSYSKLVIFDRRGKYISEKKFPYIVIQVVPLGKNYAVTKSIFNRESGTNSMGVVMFDQGMKETKTLYSRDYPHYRKSGKMDVVPELVFIREFEENVYLFDQKGDFEVLVFDKWGKPVNNIKVDIKKKKVTKNFMEKTWSWLEKDIRFRSLSEQIKRMVAFPEYFPHMKFFEVDQDLIYGHTYNYRGDLTKFLVFDSKGKVLKKLYLEGSEINTIETAPYTFNKGRYIYLKETPSLEMWALHISDVSK